MNDKERWEQFKKEIWKRYKMEKFRLNKIRQNTTMDREYKEHIETKIESSVTTLLLVMSDMEDLDASMRGIVSKELDELNKEEMWNEN